MKRTIKKHLSFLLAVVMLMTSVMFSVGAVESACTSHSIAPGNPAYYKVVNPTCEEEGYTIYYCTNPNCKAEVDRGNYVEALGHKYGSWKYKAFYNEDGSEIKGYYKYRKCIREYVNGEDITKCGSTNYEIENGKRVVYYLVKFVNNKVTATYEKDVTYTDLAATFEEELVYETYVKSGATAAYGGTELIRDKTKAYGKYDHLGWTTKSNLEATVDNNLSYSDCVSLKNITANTTFYPVFRGDSVAYSVIFYNFNEQLTNAQLVGHGNFPKFSRPDGKLYEDPKKEADIVNYYDFNGWAPAMYETSGILTESIETTHIYGDVNFYATFKPVAKNYTVEFCDYNEGEPVAVFDGVNLGTNLLTQGANSEAISNLVYAGSDMFKKPSDDIYYYTWTGEWQVLLGEGVYGSTVNLNRFEITEDDYTIAKDGEANTILLPGEREEPKKVIRLVPVFERRLVSYAVDIEMHIPSSEDSYYSLSNAEVYVVAANGQLVKSGTTDSNGRFRCYLNYQIPFTVTVATADGKYVGTKQIDTLLKDKTGNVDYEASELNKCVVPMELNPEYETHCSCIHHNSLLQPIFVRILNILYSFFNVKYVCCYDMYSTIGPLLDYTAA